MVMPEDCQSIGMMVEKSVHQSGLVTEERLANYSYLFFCIRTKIGRIRHVEDRYAVSASTASGYGHCCSSMLMCGSVQWSMMR